MGHPLAQMLMDLAALVMSQSTRLGVLSRALDESGRVLSHVRALEAGAPFEQRNLVLVQACEMLVSTLQARRAYTTEASQDYDILLRPQLVQLVKDFVNCVSAKENKTRRAAGPWSSR